ncbi:uncharacterized protein LOC143070855 isoform X2 [Mytilus galloprovincialis]|uniref:uncharacterized protein LOC143070855 isoform X2 n=1 Tax=Mytilus galloprovincialis TaxID=29158 RepID=UPI003F7C29B5
MNNVYKAFRINYSTPHGHRIEAEQIRINRMKITICLVLALCSAVSAHWYGPGGGHYGGGYYGSGWGGGWSGNGGWWGHGGGAGSYVGAGHVYVVRRGPWYGGYGSRYGVGYGDGYGYGGYGHGGYGYGGNGGGYGGYNGGGYGGGYISSKKGY